MAYVMIACGALMFLLSFIGYVGAIRESTCMLSTVSRQRKTHRTGCHFVAVTRIVTHISIAWCRSGGLALLLSFLTSCASICESYVCLMSTRVCGGRKLHARTTTRSTRCAVRCCNRRRRGAHFIMAASGFVAPIDQSRETEREREAGRQAVSQKESSKNARRLLPYSIVQ